MFENLYQKAIHIIREMDLTVNYKISLTSHKLLGTNYCCFCLKQI